VKEYGGYELSKGRNSPVDMMHQGQRGEAIMLRLIRTYHRHIDIPDFSLLAAGSKRSRGNIIIFG
jgi:hypothetical protein